MTFEDKEEKDEMVKMTGCHDNLTVCVHLLTCFCLKFKIKNRTMSLLIVLDMYKKLGESLYLRSIDIIFGKSVPILSIPLGARL